MSIGQHDFETKLRRAEQFLYRGNKVKLTLQFRGRENEHKQLGFERINLAAEELVGVSSPDSPARLVGRQVGVVLSPNPSAKRLLKFSAPDDEIDESEGDEDLEG